MARQLRNVFLGVGLAPHDLERAGGDGFLTRTSGVAWEDSGAGLWPTLKGESYVWRAALAESPAGSRTYVLDADAGAQRTCSTPILSGEGWRSWSAIELVGDEATGTTLRFRLLDGSDAWWWNAAASGGAGAWAVASTTSHWSTAAEIESHFGTWPSTERQLGVQVRLGTTLATATPAFYGWRAAIGCRPRPDDSDAAYDGLLAALADAIRAPVTLQVPYAGSGAVHLQGNPPDGGGDWTSVDAVYDVDTDPEEADTLAGTFSEGAQTWTPTAPPAAGTILLLEGTLAAPRLVALDADDVDTVVSSLPAIVLEVSGDATRTTFGTPTQIRDTRSEIPSNLMTATPAIIDQELVVRVMAARGEHAARIAAAVTSWLGDGRHLLSVETGRSSRLLPLSDLVRSSAGLAQGVYEARGRWRITYPALVGATPTRYPAQRAGGLTTTLIERS